MAESTSTDPFIPAPAPLYVPSTCERWFNMHICTETADAAVFSSATSEKSSDLHHSSLLVTVIQAIMFF